MQRRTFLQTSLATAGLAAVPGASAASTQAPNMAASARYAWAVAAAKARDVISADAIAAGLKVSASEANALMARLQARGVIGEVASGSARVIAPVFRASGFTGGVIKSTTARAATPHGLADKLKAVVREELSPSDADPERQEASNEVRSAE